MKNIINNANAIIKGIVACTAKANAFKTSKTLFLFIFAATVLFSSFARNTASGCGAWACKSNMKYENERKYAKHTATMYKCPANQRYSR